MASAPPGPENNPYAPPQAIESNLPEAQGGLTHHEVVAFVGNNHPYYHSRWWIGAPRGWWAGFNWAAAFCQELWLVYRRMYIEALSVYLGSWLLIYLAMFVWGKLSPSGDGRPMVVLPGIITFVCFGLFGNGYYRRRALAAAAVARQEPNMQLRLAALTERGGTRGWHWPLALAAQIGISIAVERLPF